MSNTQELCRSPRSGVLNGGLGPQKHEYSQLFAKKVAKLGFPFGGQTAPSEPAPRVGGAGDVLAGLLPSHSNKLLMMQDFKLFDASFLVGNRVQMFF